MNLKYVAIDLDGTLLDENKRISIENRNALKRIQGLGIELIIASGRHYHEVVSFMNEARIDGCRYVICRDGHDIYDRGTQVFSGASINADDIRLIMDSLQLSTVFCSNRLEDYLVFRSTALLFKHCFKTFFSRRRNESAALLSIGLMRLKNVLVDKVILFNAKSFSSVFEKGPFTMHYLNEGKVLDIFAYGVNKYNALRWLSEYVGFNLDELLYIGDDYNDEECFENLTNCIVMGNAPQVLKEYSILKDVPDNNSNGVADSLIRLFYLDENSCR